MKKALLLSAVMLLLVIVSVSAQQQAGYDKASVVTLMHDNGAELGALTRAVTANDFDDAAMRLSRLAANMSRLLPLTPPKGTKAQWDANAKAFLTASYQGIAAVVEKDATGLQAAVAEVRKQQQACHAQFR